MPRPGVSSSKRVWLGGGAVVAVVIVLAGWFLVINPELSTASANRNQTVAADLQNQVLQQRNDELKAKNGDKGALQAGLAAALQQLPSDGGLPAFTRQLSAQAKAADVDLTSVTVGAATARTGAAASAPATPAAEPTTVTATPTADVPAGSGTTASTGLVQMTVSVSASGLGRRELAFLRAIQWSGPRRALVSAVQLSPMSGGGAAGIDGPCTLSMTLTIFSAPLSPSAQAALVKLLSEK